MKRIGIIGAMEEEVALLKEQMQIEKKVEKASMEFCAGKLNGQEAVVVRSGICLLYTSEKSSIWDIILKYVN